MHSIVRWALVFVLTGLLALGCGGDGTDGTGGTGGAAGSAGSGGAAGSPGSGGAAGTAGVGGDAGAGGIGGGAGAGGSAGSAGAGGAAGNGGASGQGGGELRCVGDPASGDSDDDGVCDSDDVCPGENDLIDVDDNQVADCTENLLANSELDSDVSSWEAGTQATLAWDELDADGDPNSGSAAVTNIAGQEGFVRSAGQCVETGEGNYVAATRYYIPAGQGPARARINMTFHSNSSCIGGAGNFLGNSVSTVQDTTGSWGTILHPFSTVSGTQSINFLLNAQTLDASPALTVQYDNPLLRCQSNPVMMTRPYTGGGGSWYGGDDRAASTPRLVGAGAQVPVTETFLAERFGLYVVRRFDYDDAATGTGHAVTLIAQLRDASGNILEVATTDLPATFAGGWAYWDFSTVLQAGETYNFTTYVQDGFSSGLRSSLGYGDANLYPTVDRLTCTVGHDAMGQPLVDIDDWGCWGVGDLPISFTLEGVSVCE